MGSYQLPAHTYSYQCVTPRHRSCTSRRHEVLCFDKPAVSPSTPTTARTLGTYCMACRAPPPLALLLPLCTSVSYICCSPAADPASQDTPGDLSERVVSLEAQLADLQQAHTIGPTPADLASQLSSLRKHVDDKVDRAEFDALLASGAAAGALMGDDIPRVELAEDGTIDVKALAEGVNRSLGDCGALRAMTMVLQERVASKVCSRL
ncbi:hypothetical protein V8C86DRAFT_916791 [Haematococcus lacustris]